MWIAVVGVVFALGLVSPVSAQHEEPIYRPGNGVSAPRLVKDIKPQYSYGAMRRGVTGTVLLRCVVDRDGVPTRVEIITPLDEELDRTSLEALKQWRFEPGRKDGQPVLVQLDIAMAFTTQTKKSVWRRLWRR